MSKRKMFAIILAKIGIDRLLHRLGLVRSKLTVLAYHRICPNEDFSDAGDLDLISATPEQFESQVKYIRQYFTPISVDNLIASLHKNERLPDNSILITFDDGFEDNYLHAAPILQKYGVPGVIFCTTGLIDTQECIWFEEVSLIIRARGQELLKKGLHLSIDNIIKRVVNRLKLSENSERLNTIIKLKKKYGVPSRHAKILSSQQIKDLIKMDVDVGSHTVTHPILSNMTEQDMILELSESSRRLEKITGKKCLAFSYPNGSKNDYSANTICKLKQTGYDIAFNYQSGNNALPIGNSYDLYRIHVERYTSLAEFKMSLLLPNVFSYD